MIESLTAYLHNRYHNIQLPAVLGFFGGSSFVPIVTAFVGIFVGAAFYIIWPPFQYLLVNAGNIISTMGPFVTFLYGFLMRLCRAVGHIQCSGILSLAELKQ